MITIGQLARYVGVSVKTIRVYHDKGLFPEPERDGSGYRRYGADEVIALIKIRTLAEAGVPLARIRDLGSAAEEELQDALHEIDDELTARIRGLRAARGRLRRLAAGDPTPLPDEVGSHLERLTGWGFTPRWVALQRELWILVFATHPDLASTLFHDQAETLADPALRQLHLDYDHAHDLDAEDPRIDDLARRITDATRRRYGSDALPGLDTGSEIPALVQGSVNASSPAWRRLDGLLGRFPIPREGDACRRASGRTCRARRPGSQSLRRCRLPESLADQRFELGAEPFSSSPRESMRPPWTGPVLHSETRNRTPSAELPVHRAEMPLPSAIRSTERPQCRA
ncbi:MerR family transcriptional regulator [Streptomyces sp. NPDC058746]|uniref:MerR family transcriptional regulator n=1 Tax=Streptomyces sp. NPDC058746 TaxID=3346622 RepID=UPI0036A1D658